MLLLSTSDPSILYSVLLYVQDAIGKNLSRVFDHSDHLQSIFDDNSGVKLIWDLRGRGAIWIIFLTFTKNDLAEQQPLPVHQADPGQLGEVDAVTE